MARACRALTCSAPRQSPPSGRGHCPMPWPSPRGGARSRALERCAPRRRRLVPEPPPGTSVRSSATGGHSDFCSAKRRLSRSILATRSARSAHSFSVARNSSSTFRQSVTAPSSQLCRPRQAGCPAQVLPHALRSFASASNALLTLRSARAALAVRGVLRLLAQGRELCLIAKCRFRCSISRPGKRHRHTWRTRAARRAAHNRSAHACHRPRRGAWRPLTPATPRRASAPCRGGPAKC